MNAKKKRWKSTILNLRNLSVYITRQKNCAAIKNCASFPPAVPVSAIQIF
jgi:hypothetical protein